jgi:hypothetical protein
VSAFISQEERAQALRNTFVDEYTAYAAKHFPGGPLPDYIAWTPQSVRSLACPVCRSRERQADLAKWEPGFRTCRPWGRDGEPA